MTRKKKTKEYERLLQEAVWAGLEEQAALEPQDPFEDGKLLHDLLTFGYCMLETGERIYLMPRKTNEDWETVGADG